MNRKNESRRKFGTVALALIVLLLAAGCQQQDSQLTVRDRDMRAMDHHAEVFADVKIAVARLIPTEGNRAAGTVTFIENDEGVRVIAEVTGLEPNREHGFHIHEYGDITCPEGTKAGDHYSPEGHDHGLPDQRERHAGDLGNLRADAQGNARLELTVHNITVAGIHNPIIGRAVIVHSDPDDGSQPLGDAGDRIAQGVIGVADPEEIDVDA